MTTAHSGENTNIILAGVGGQGSITAGQIAARAASLAGKGVVMSEVHGMAQRGGSVMSTVRYGNMQSPVVSRGKADYLLGFEKLEALRYAQWLTPTGVAIVSDQRITPTIQALKIHGYPVEIEEKLRAFTQTVVMVPALDIAEQLGNPKLIGAVILGAFSAFMDIPSSNWAQALGETVPSKTIALNLQAFETGHEFTQSLGIPQHGKLASGMENNSIREDAPWFESA